MGNDEIKKLLADADLILTYAVRAGRLHDDSLPNAIREVEASLSAGNTPNLVSLSSAINAAVTAISPITLVDLRAGRSPFDKDGPTSRPWLQYWLCGITILLAALIAFWSFTVQRKENALREYQDVRTANIPEKFIALYRMSQEEDVKSQKGPRYEQYQRNVNEIQNLSVRNQTAVNLLIDQELTRWPFQAEIRATIDSIALLIVGQHFFEPELSQNKDKYTDLKNNYDDFCTESPPAQSASKTRLATSRQVVSRENRDQFCFKQMFGIQSDTALLYTASIRDSITLLSVWILPFLSGLLGATIFLLRDSLSPLTANFGAARAVVRLALGGVAGIIIGWFWLPSGTFGIDAIKGSPVPIALSFLTGFSIDILFSALDRLRESLSAAQTPPK